MSRVGDTLKTRWLRVQKSGGVFISRKVLGAIDYLCVECNRGLDISKLPPPHIYRHVRYEKSAVT